LALFHSPSFCPVFNEKNCILDIVVKAISWPKEIGSQVFGYLDNCYGRLWNLRITLIKVNGAGPLLAGKNHYSKLSLNFNFTSGID